MRIILPLLNFADLGHLNVYQKKSSSTFSFDNVWTKISSFGRTWMEDIATQHSYYRGPSYVDSGTIYTIFPQVWSAVSTIKHGIR